MKRTVAFIITLSLLLSYGILNVTAEEERSVNEGIQNGDFSDGLTGWSVTGDEAASVTDGVLIISGSEYKTKVSQTVSGLQNGVYDLSVTAKTSDIDGIAYVYAKTAGHTIASTAIPKTTDLEIIVPNVIVGDGSCEIGVCAEGSATITADNFSFSSSSETRVSFLKGGEISKLTYVEDNGGRFYRADNSEGDALQIMAENGMNLARIRVLNDPGKGHGNGTYYLPGYYQTTEDCLDMARRAKDKGMRILFTFAYSDYWSDGGEQFIPHEWQEEITSKGLSGEEMYKYLEDKTYEFTKDVMTRLINQGTRPEFVSIGNEMQYGLYFGRYQDKSPMYNSAAMLAGFLNAGARAVRETSPETKIVLHSDNGGKLSQRKTFRDVLSMVDFDVIGVSYYPYYNSDVTIDTVVNEFNSLIKGNNKDVIIMETGYNWTELRGDNEEGQLKNSGAYQNIYGESEEGQRAFLTELYAKLKKVAGGRCIGDIYWDPVMLYDGGTYKIGWAMKTDEYGDWTQGNVVSNSTIFDFNGIAVKGQLAMKYNSGSDDNINITGTIKNGSEPVTEKAVTFTVNGKKYNTSTDKFGEYIVSVPYPESGKLRIGLNGSGVEIEKDAPPDGVFVSGTDFEDFDAQTARENFILNTWEDKDGRICYSTDYSVSSADKLIFITALYDDSDTLISCSYKSDGSFNPPERDGKYKIKAFLWKENMQSIYNSAEEEITIQG